MAVNAQQIKQFNQRNQAAAAGGQGTPSGNNPPAKVVVPPIKPNSKMSVSDIALLQKDPSKLTEDDIARLNALDAKQKLSENEQLIHNKALQTKEAARRQEEEEERLREEQLEADRKQGRYDRVATSQVIRGLRSLDKATSEQRSWIARAPTVGGVGVLLAIIVLFLMAVIPVDKQGRTRLFLIWLTLTGKASVALPAGTGPGVGNNVNTNTNTDSTVSGPPAPPPSPTVLPDTSTPKTPTSINFTLPAVFQNGTSNLLDSLFS